MAVAPRRRPRSSNTCRVPSLRPKIPSMVMALQLDLDVDTTGQLEAHQGVDGLGGGLEDVDEPLVGADFELFAGVLIDVGTPDDGELLYGSWERHGAGHGCARALRGLDDLSGRLVEEACVGCLQLD